MMALHTCASVAIAAGLLLSATAARADGGRRAAVTDYASPAINWSGAYAGVHIGAGWQNAESKNSAVLPNPLLGTLVERGIGDGAIPATMAQDGSRIIGGVTLGYNFQNGAFVYGVELDGTWLDAGESSSTTTTVTSPFVYPTMTTRTETKTEWLATLRARAGTLVTPQTLLFVTGGLAAGHVKGTTSITPDQCDMNAYCSAGSGSETRWGWTAGGGVEHAINANWTLKLEYLYYDLGSFSYTANEISAAFVASQGVPNMKIETEVTGQILQAGINFRF